MTVKLKIGSEFIDFPLNDFEVETLDETIYFEKLESLDDTAKIPIVEYE